MGKTTEIGWTHHTFNEAWGCTEVSPGCDNCYARTLSSRYGHNVWGKDGGRRTFGPKHWAEPLKWNTAAEDAGERRRVFCNSMADWADAHPLMVSLLSPLFKLIKLTPHLDWLLLTKRHSRIARSLPEDWGDGYPNVWLGVSVENQEWADRRIPELLKVPAAVRFLSCEPLLGPIDLNKIGAGPWSDSLNGWRLDSGGVAASSPAPMLDWVIVGGESGPGHRPMELEWLTSLAEQCGIAGTSCFVKQDSGSKPGKQGRIPDEIWQLKQFPEVAHA